MSTFQYVVETEKCYGGSQQKRPLAENENTDSTLNKENGMDKDTKRLKGLKGKHTSVGVEARTKASKETPTERYLYIQRRKYKGPH